MRLENTKNTVPKPLKNEVFVEWGSRRRGWLGVRLAPYTVSFKR